LLRERKLPSIILISPLSIIVIALNIGFELHKHRYLGEHAQVSAKMDRAELTFDPE